MKTLVVIACLVAYACAHMCMICPQQRGGFKAGTLSTAGAEQCLIMTDPPCGKTKPTERPVHNYTAGDEYSFVIQKNFNHFNSARPGSIDLYLWYGDEGKKKLLAHHADSDNIKALEDIAINVTIPEEVTPGRAIVQGIYTTNNPNAPAMFYQCADVIITKKRH